MADLRIIEAQYSRERIGDTHPCSNNIDMSCSPVQTFMAVLGLNGIAACTEPVEHIDLSIYSALGIDQQDRNFGVKVGGAF